MQAQPVPNAAQRAREGQAIGSFVVTAKGGFSISGRHKFNMVRRGNTVKVEYCRVCRQARRFLKVAGADVDYVKESLAKQSPMPVEQFDRLKMLSEFTDILLTTYSDLGGK